MSDQPPKKTNFADIIRQDRPPTINIVPATTADNAAATIEGFDQVEMWARHHNPTWVATYNQARAAQLEEIDRLRLLAANLLATNVELKRHLFHAMRTSSILPVPPAPEPPKEGQ